MFVRAKKRKDQTYYYLVENYRDNGRIRQRVVGYLGQHSSLDKAIDACLKGIETQRQWQMRWLKTEVARPGEKPWLAYARQSDASAKELELKLERLLALRARAQGPVVPRP